MTKLEFIFALEEKLSTLPQDDAHEQLQFYIEMIEDRMEEGLSEEEAVAAVGAVDEIAAQIISGFSPVQIIKSKEERKSWEIILLILSAPLWIPLLITVIAVIFSLYVSLWSVIVSLWATFASIIGGAIAGFAAGIGLIVSNNAFGGIAFLGSALVCAGLAILMFFGCKLVTKGTILLTKKIFLWFRSCFTRKEKVV